MSRTAINLADKFSKFSEHWSPKVVARMNDYEFKLGGTRKLWDTLDQVSGFNGGHADRFPTLYP